MATRKPSVSAAKKRAWTAFSIYIRTRDCLAYKQLHPELWDLAAACVTCRRVYPFKQLQAGHFIAGRTNSILFDERGVHAQCYACNVRDHGNTTQYWLFMEENYGRIVIDDLMFKKNHALKLSAAELDQMTQEFKQKTAALMEN